MKKVSFLRHAKSEPDETGIGDFLRPLAERGWSDSERLGDEMERLNVALDFVIASPARRCRETLEGLARRLKIDVEPYFEERLYLARSDTLFSIIGKFPDHVLSALVIGHNPGLQEIVLELADGPNDLERKIEHKLPTAAFVELELPIERWTDVRRGEARIERLLVPRKRD